MKNHIFLLLCFFAFSGWLGGNVQAQQLIDNCALHYDVFDFYNPTVVRKICMKCIAPLNDMFVLRNDFQECIRTTNIIDGYQSCQQISLDGKCKQTITNTTVVDSATKTIIPRTTVSQYCAQANGSQCTYPVFPYYSTDASASAMNGFEKGHYGFLYISSAQEQYFLFDFQNFDQLRNTTISTLTDRLYCKPGYTFTESGCLKNTDPFPNILNCVNQIGDYCYECTQGFTLQNTRQSCQQLGDGCSSFEVIRGQPVCIKCDDKYTLYKGVCTLKLVLAHRNIRLKTFCRAPYFSQYCESISKQVTQNCEIADQQTGLCAQCSNVDAFYFDSKSNSCKSRVFSTKCTLKHPISDSCLVTVCAPGYRYRYPLPLFYPPIYFFVDAKYEQTWRNQFLAPKPNIVQDECIIDNIYIVDPNCSQYDKTGRVCLQCVNGYWITGNSTCSNDLSKYPDIANCVSYTPSKNRCTQCNNGFILKSGTCQADNGSNCLVYDGSGNCTLCKQGYYPFGVGCSLQDLCWLGTAIDSYNNSYTSCSACRRDTVKQVMRLNDVCQYNSSNDNCVQKSSTDSYCYECILGYVVSDTKTYCDKQLSASRYCYQFNKYNLRCITSKPGWYNFGDSYSYNVEIYRDNRNLGASCQYGYVDGQCDTCSNNCAVCQRDVCFSCQPGFTLNKYKECV